MNLRALVTLLFFATLSAYAEDGSVRITCEGGVPVRGSDITIVLENSKVTSLSLNGLGDLSTALSPPGQDKKCEVSPADGSRLLKVQCLSAGGIERYQGVASFTIEPNKIELVTSHGTVKISGDRSCVAILQLSCAI